MLSSCGVFSLLLLPLLASAQWVAKYVCMSGQCREGYSNTTIGVTLASSSPSVLLLPGMYTSAINPQELRDALTSRSVRLAPSAGFGNSTSVSLPLNVALQPGLSTYTGPLYSGQAAFTSIPSILVANASTFITAKALALSSNTWASFRIGASNIVVWEAIPDLDQLPLGNQGNVSLIDLQSSACSPTCASTAVCSPEGTCQCPPGFTGDACEFCASGFFGSDCQACPGNCQSCDDGINGTGRCLKPEFPNAPAKCNCKNGVCGPNGQCTCTAGFAIGNGGIACSKCASGFFLTPSGDCQICQLGCTSCADGTGVCSSCKSGFSQDGNDSTKCNPPASATSSGQICPDGSFSNGNNCTSCSSACSTCIGGSSNDCIVCAPGTFTFNGQCVSTNEDGVCQGSSLIADNNKRECDTCGATCTKCKIANFSVTSTVDQKECLECLPGLFLSNGKCVQNCPSGTTVSSQDNMTCIPYDPSCLSCSGSPTFCLTCPNNQLASGGKCVQLCPSGTFSSSGTCLTCHPDCASCSGAAFGQCSNCPRNRPVLLNGRCLSTCSNNQFFDPTAAQCQTCDSACSSCSGAGPDNCLACSSSTQVLRGGSCVAANCRDSSNVVASLGVCLSEFVISTLPNGTNADPLPPITVLDSPLRKLQVWQIALIVVCCLLLFLILLCLCCCRRRRRKQQEEKMEMYITGNDNMHVTNNWRTHRMRFGERIFGHKHKRSISIVHMGPKALDENYYMNTRKIIRVEDTSPQVMIIPPVRPPPPEEDVDMVGLIAAYNEYDPEHPRYHLYQQVQNINIDEDRRSISSETSNRSAPSLYSQLTGIPRHGPDPRQPVKNGLISRFSVSTHSTDRLNKSGNIFKR